MSRFSRTGALFAAEHAGVTPDVMCVGKALTGGYLSLAAALCTPEVAAGISRGELPVLAHRADIHGQPAGLRGREGASLDVLLGTEAALVGPVPRLVPAPPPDSRAPPALDLPPRGWRAAGLGRSAARLRAGLPPAADLPAVADVRVLGAIGVVQLDHDVDIAAATAAAVRAGVWLRPFRDLVYTMPPYVTSPARTWH